MDQLASLDRIQLSSNMCFHQQSIELPLGNKRLRDCSYIIEKLNPKSLRRSMNVIIFVFELWKTKADLRVIEARNYTVPNWLFCFSRDKISLRSYETNVFVDDSKKLDERRQWEKTVMPSYAINAHVFWSKFYSYGERFLNPLPPIKMVRVRNGLQPWVSSHKSQLSAGLFGSMLKLSMQWVWWMFVTVSDESAEMTGLEKAKETLAG